MVKPNSDKDEFSCRVRVHRPQQALETRDYGLHSGEWTKVHRNTRNSSVDFYLCSQAILIIGNVLDDALIAFHDKEPSATVAPLGNRLLAGGFVHEAYLSAGATVE